MELSIDLGELKSVGEDNKPDPDQLYDVLILGGGPAAMTAAIYASRKMLKVAVVTDEFGGQVGETTEIENYLGFQMVGGKELVGKFLDHMKKFDIPAAQRERVVEIARDDMAFKARTKNDTVYRGRTLICALGRRYKHLEIPGEDTFAGKGVSYCEICDAPFFVGKRVVVAGGGNSAFTAAMDLMKIASAVTVVNHSPGWKADAVLFEPVEKHEKVTLIDNHDFVRIEGDRRVTAAVIRDKASGEEKRIETDGVFVEIGGKPNTEPLGDLAKLDRFGELIIDCRCETSVDGLFGAGDVTNVPYKQIVVSAGEGSKAALSAYEYLVNKGLI